jgi:hypothetical protein
MGFVGAHLNVVASFILSCFALLKFEGIVVRVSPIRGTKKSKMFREAFCHADCDHPFFNFINLVWG